MQMNITFQSKRVLITAAAVALINWSSLATCSARVVTIGIANGNALAFFPAVTNIATGDQVVWNWNNTVNQHSTTDTGVWDSGLHPNPFAFTNTFNTAGTFPYFCSLHSGFGMTGSIIVSAPNLPPVVTITNPSSGTVLAAPANLTIQASATDDGSVTNVQFLVGSVVVTNQTAAPYSATTNNLAAGSYTLSAIATDNLGVKATNAVTLSVVTPVTITISAPARTSASNFQFSYAANVGLRYVIQRSTNLLVADWLTLATNTAAANPANFADTNATTSPGFYRVGRLPNP